METPSLGVPELLFLLRGLMWTVALTVMAFALGGVGGLLVALARSAGSRWLRWPATGWIALFQGTPLLMQLFVFYYGFALMGLRIPAWLAVAIALTAHASAFLGEIWRGAIQAIPKGQTEAAHALGLHYGSRMRDVVLPQAFRLSLPATIGFAVQLLKGTSLVSIVGFTELARAGEIVANQTFQFLPIYALIGALYFALCWPLSLWGSGVERRLARAAR